MNLPPTIIEPEQKVDDMGILAKEVEEKKSSESQIEEIPKPEILSTSKQE